MPDIAFASEPLGTIGQPRPEQHDFLPNDTILRVVPTHVQVVDTHTGAVMNKLKRAINFMLVTACVLSTSVFYGCGADSLGPYEPLLPAIEGEAKFSNRFQLEEEPQFFYDLYGKEIVEGSELNTYTDRKEFDKNTRCAS